MWQGLTSIGRERKDKDGKTEGKGRKREEARVKTEESHEQITARYSIITVVTTIAVTAILPYMSLHMFTCMDVQKSGM